MEWGQERRWQQVGRWHPKHLIEYQRTLEGKVVSMRQGVSPPHLFRKILGKCKLVRLGPLDP